MNEPDAISTGRTGSRDAACSATPRTDRIMLERHDEPPITRLCRQMEIELAEATANLSEALAILETTFKKLNVNRPNARSAGDRENNQPYETDANSIT